MVLIKGIQKTSLLDYPPHVVSTIFTAGCNFRCVFCYNKDIVLHFNTLETISEEDLVKHLEERRKYLDGVCITGGEPTMYKDLPKLISKIKGMGFLVKLDTNGTNPEMLSRLIDKGIVDYVAMDIKGPLEKYEKIVEAKINTEDIQRSIDLLRKGEVEYEFRTTVVPELITKEDLENIGKWLSGSKKYFIQNFLSDTDTIDDYYTTVKSYSGSDLRKFKSMLKPYFEKVEVRGM